MATATLAYVIYKCPICGEMANQVDDGLRRVSKIFRIEDNVIRSAHMMHDDCIIKKLVDDGMDRSTDQV